MTEQPNQSANRWLSAHANKYWSQFGEDGIIEKMLEILPTTDHWCVEFGAWDGMNLSNTCYFITRKQYSAVLIEGDPVRFQTLTTNFRNNSNVHAFNRLVGFNEADGLDAILARTPIPADFDVLSIDIDGNDYHVWAAINRYRPKIVVIEYNPTIPDPVEFVQAANPQTMQGSSILSLCNLAKRKGYELVSVTFCNLLFVDSQYYPLFKIRDNSIAELRMDRSAITYLFQGYDGTVFLSGSPSLHWHRIPFHPTPFQLLPAQLRKYPDNYTEAERTLFQLYREFYQRLLQKEPSAVRQLPGLGEPGKQINLDPHESALWSAICNTMQQIQQSSGR